MITLEHLPPPPVEHKMTVAENEGILMSAGSFNQEENSFVWMNEQSFDVKVLQETARPAHSKYDAKDAFFAHKETLWQRMTMAYHRDGIAAAIAEIMEDKDTVSPYIVKLASLYITCHNLMQRVKILLPLQHEVQTSPTIHNTGASTTVVCMAWHPHTQILALAFADDIVRIYGKGRAVTPILKHRDQRNITHVEWMKYSASMLALSCQAGIMLWTLDPLSVVARPSGSCTSLLSHSSMVPAKSFSWHPQGILLCSVGGKGRNLAVWDVGKEARIVVHKSYFTNIAYVLWSSDGRRVLASLDQPAIKIFESREWTYERYKLNEPLKTAVWSSSGHLLLFTTVSDPLLHALYFDEDDGVGGSSTATQVADFTLVSLIDADGQEVKVGGSVKAIAWDEQNERLAVIFNNTEFIALFHTYCQPQLHISPGGFIRGYPNEMPTHIAFQKKIHGGSILTTIWTNGQVKHIPMKYSSRTLINFNHSASWAPPNQTVIGTPYQSNRSVHHATLNNSTVLNTPIRELFTSP